jgi:hypothetical protein
MSLVDSNLGERAATPSSEFPLPEIVQDRSLAATRAPATGMREPWPVIVLLFGGLLTFFWNVLLCVGVWWAVRALMNVL